MADVGAEALARLAEAADTQHTCVMTWQHARVVLDGLAHEKARAEQAESERAAVVEHNRELIAERRTLLDTVERVKTMADEWTNPQTPGYFNRFAAELVRAELRLPE